MLRKVKLKCTLLVIILAALASVISIAAHMFYQPQADRVIESQVRKILQADSMLNSSSVVAQHSVKLPRDYAFHSDFQHEWWNYFATVHDNTGKKYFIHWSCFRLANADNRDALGWTNSQIYSSHIVISTDKQVWKEQRVARGGIGQAGFNSHPFRLWIDNWAWRSLGRAAFPGHLDVKSDKFALSLYSDNHGRIILPGSRGVQQKHSYLPLATYNMQAPYLSVYGQLQLSKGASPVSVEGKAWISKEWGSGLITDQQLGWDWFVINLDETSTLSIKRMRHESQLPYLFGTLSTQDGQVTSLNNEDITVTPLNNVELENGKVIPMQWHIVIEKLGIDIKTSADNENLWLPFSIPYWQGSVTTTGSNVTQGYIQSVGY